MSVQFAQQHSLCPLALGIEVIEAAAGAKPEETSPDLLLLEQQAHGSLKEAVDFYISCSLEYQRM